MRRSKSSRSSSEIATHSYDDFLLPSREAYLPLPVPCAHGNTSDSDSEDDDVVGRRHSILTDDWSGWASRMGLPLTLIEYTTIAPTFKQQHLHRIIRTRSQFKPSYLLQKRKQALVQHHQQRSPYLYLYSTGTSMMQMPMNSRRHSYWALLFLLAACYALFCLSISDTTITATLVPADTTSSATTYYYLNMREGQPLEMIAIMLALHARLFGLPHAQFAGVCGYPTYQLASQQQALVMLSKLRLETILPSWDVCPPVDAILQDDPHYVLVEEQDVERGWHLYTPQWKRWMQEHRQQRQEPTIVNSAVLQHYAQQPQQDAMYEALWQKLISGATSTSPPQDTLQRLPPPLHDLIGPQPQPHQPQQQEAGARILGTKEQPVVRIHAAPLQSSSQQAASLQNLAVGHDAESTSSPSHIRRRRV